MQKVNVVIPNWNGASALPACLDSLLAQSQKSQIIVVENGSTDNSRGLLYSKYPQVEVIPLPKNTGFTGVNTGIRQAIKNKVQYVALLNNDATADPKWLKNLVDFLEDNPKAGIATSKILSHTGEYLDSTADLYTIWGLPHPRGRREADTGKYDNDIWVFGASGGASLYRVETLEDIGLFDEDFFAYYEDVDISFRAQLAGWKVAYVPSARVYHQIGGTSAKIKGFATYQTMKNLPWLLVKNVPGPLLGTVLPRFILAYVAFFASSISRGQAGPASKGFLKMLWLLVKKISQRRKIQRGRQVSIKYIDSLLVHDLPPNARKLRSLRSRWWKLRKKAEA